MGARVVEAAWQGFNASGISWPGLEIGADLSATYVNTLCGDSPLCSASWANWLANFVAADPSFDPSNLSTEEFAQVLARAIALWRSSLGAANPRLQPFRQAGGKRVHIILCELKWQEIRVRKIAIVMRLFLGAHGSGLTRPRIE